MRVFLFILFGGLGLYGLTAYVVLPMWWERYEKRHPALRDAEKITRTGAGIPGDPVNIGLIATVEDIHRAILAAGWYPANAITLESSLRIAADVVMRRPYDDAPVSPLYLWGRKEDLAFERPVGDDPRRRHHVRFWRSEKADADGMPLWLGAATMDVRVGFSHDTGQITHHIAPEVDLERDKLIADLSKAGDLARVEWIEHFHAELSGKNGGGDPWHTDGKLAIGILTVPPTQRPVVAPAVH